MQGRQLQLRQNREYIGIMEKKMETTIVNKGYIGIIWKLYRDHGKQNGNYD